MGVLGFLWFVLVILPWRVVHQALQAVNGKGSRFRKYRTDALRLGLLELASQAFRIDPKYHWLVNLRPQTLLHLVERSHKSIVSTLPNYGKFFDSQLYWIVEQPDRQKLDPILIYLHGGGFTFQAVPQQIEAVLLIYALTLPETRKRLSILNLNYKLAGNGYPNPIQLKQLGLTYENLVREGNLNFIFLGDSAGGTLAVTYLQALKENQKVLPLPFPKALLLVSPWIKLKPDYNDYQPGHSYYDNDSRDYIPWSVLRLPKRLQVITGDSKIDTLTISPGNCPANHDDWDISTLENVIVVTGEDEIIRDDIFNWCKIALGIPIDAASFAKDSEGVVLDRHKYVRNQDKIQVHVEPYGVHDAMLLEAMSIMSELDDGVEPENISRVKYFGIPKLAAYLDNVCH